MIYSVVQYQVYLHSEDEDYEFKGTDQVKVFHEAVNFLVRDFQLIDQVTIPYVPGETKALINQEPVNSDSSAMHQYKQLDNGYYLNVNYNRGEKQSHLKRLSSECGLDIFFFGWD